MDEPVRAIIDELGRHVYSKAYLTLLTARGEASKWRLRRVNGRVQFIDKYETELFAEIVMDALHYGFLVIVLRSFTGERRRGRVIKELRAYRVMRRGGIVISKVPMDELITSMNVNSMTGELMQPEPFVKYCVDDECIYSDEIDERDLEVYIRNIKKWVN